MKHCFQCGRTTSGEPLFCNFCGSSFDVKLCPRLHPNPRIAEVCSQCGSHELSEPQPEVSLWMHLVAYVILIVSGAVLVCLSFGFIVALIQGLLTRPELQAGTMAIAFLLIAFWILWTMLPDWMRKIVRRLIGRKERKHER